MCFRNEETVHNSWRSAGWAVRRRCCNSVPARRLGNCPCCWHTRGHSSDCCQSHRCRKGQFNRVFRECRFPLSLWCRDFRTLVLLQTERRVFALTFCHNISKHWLMTWPERFIHRSCVLTLSVRVSTEKFVVLWLASWLLVRVTSIVCCETGGVGNIAIGWRWQTGDWQVMEVYNTQRSWLDVGIIRRQLMAWGRDCWIEYSIRHTRELGADSFERQLDLDKQLQGTTNWLDSFLSRIFG